MLLVNKEQKKKSDAVEIKSNMSESQFWDVSGCSRAAFHLWHQSVQMAPRFIWMVLKGLSIQIWRSLEVAHFTLCIDSNVQNLFNNHERIPRLEGRSFLPAWRPHLNHLRGFGETWSTLGFCSVSHLQLRGWSLKRPARSWLVQAELGGRGRGCRGMCGSLRPEDKPVQRERSGQERWTTSRSWALWAVAPCPSPSSGCWAACDYASSWTSPCRRPHLTAAQTPGHRTHPRRPRRLLLLSGPSAPSPSVLSAVTHNTWDFNGGVPLEHEGMETLLHFQKNFIFLWSIRKKIISLDVNGIKWCSHNSTGLTKQKSTVGLLLPLICCRGVGSEVQRLNRWDDFSVSSQASCYFSSSFLDRCFF